MTSRRIAFLDVDGTLIDHQQRLAPSAIEAVRGARARGHLVYLCTGRARAEIPDHVAAIGFDGVISAGGGFTDRGDEHVARHLMPPEDLAELTAFFEAHDVEYILQAYDDIYPSRGILARVRPIFDGAEAGADDPAAVAALARVEKRMAYKGPAPVDAIAKAAHEIAVALNLKAITAWTSSGSTALRIARERPDSTVIALTPNRATARRLTLVWGVHAIVTKDASDADDMAFRACKFAVREGFSVLGDRIIVVAGVPFGTPGATNMVRIAFIANEHVAKA